jgi:3-phenylpropionate/cinnamic acid dioxygenase small subunit
VEAQVISQCKPRHRHQEFLIFLRHLDANTPAGLALHLVLDNYATHKHPKVKAWLARHPRFHLHFTPTYSSWLNQIERWFGLITQQAIAMSVRRTRARPRLRSAVSGKLIAIIWACNPRARRFMDAQLHFMIERLITDYVHCIDDGRLAEWPGFFAEPCLYKIVSAENYERGFPIGVFFANTRGMLQDRVSALREANIYEPQRYRHLVSSIRILEQPGSGVPAESNFLVTRIMQDGGLQVKRSRSSALDYCLDDGRREESEPSKTGDISLRQTFAPSNFSRRAHSTKGDLLEPSPGARHRPEQRQIGTPRQVVLALDYDPQFHAAAFHPHWDQAANAKATPRS